MQAKITKYYQNTDEEFYLPVHLHHWFCPFHTSLSFIFNYENKTFGKNVVDIPYFRTCASEYFGNINSLSIDITDYFSINFTQHFLYIGCNNLEYN